MLKTLLLLTALALVQARPSDDAALTNVRLYELHEDCPPTEVHFLLPHEYDCTKFYYCEYGLKWIEPRNCAPGTEFNAEIQVCVHPISSGCTLPGFPSTPEPAPETTAAPTIAPTTPEVVTPEPTTPEATTPEPTTPEPTTPEPTTPEPTTPEPTTSEPTTTEVTTPEPTTPEVTTPEPTTPEVTTPEPTTPDVTTPEPTTPEVTTPEPTTPEVTTPEPTTPEVTTPEPTTPEVTTPEPTTPEVTTPEPTTPEVTTPEPTTPEVTTPEPTTPEVTTPEPTTPEVSTLTPTEPTYDTEGPVVPTAAPTAAPSTSAPASTADPDDCETLDNGCPADFHIHKLLPHEEYCHQFYYCDKGQLVLRSCAPGTYFNPKLEVCDWPHNVDCVNDDSYEYPTTSAPTTQPPSPPGDGDNDIGDILDNGCPADFDVHHLLPHETECNKFYYCVFGEKVERSCAPGTYFNYEIQVCDWPFNVNCASAGTTQAEATGTTQGEATGTTQGEATGTTPGGATDDTSSSEEIPISSDPEDPENPIQWVPLPNGCPADFDVHHLLPHESDCDKFYYCVNGQILETECPPGTHFSPSQQICDWPQYAGCEHWNGGCSGSGDDNGGCAGTTAAPGENDGTTAAPGGNDGTTAAPGSNDGTTAAPGGNDGTTAAPGGNDGTTTAPGGNDETTIAPGGNDGTTAAPGGNDGTTAAPGGNDGTTAAPGGNDGTTAAPGGNDGTTAAPGGNDETTVAPGGNDGTTADPGCNTCLPVTPADKCKSGCNVLPFVHDNDCDKYWVCNGDEPLLVTCSEGLHFNPSTYTCDFICNAGCLRQNAQITPQAEGVKVFLPWGSITSEMMDLLGTKLNADL